VVSRRYANDKSRQRWQPQANTSIISDIMIFLGSYFDTTASQNFPTLPGASLLHDCRHVKHLRDTAPKHPASAE